MKNVYPDENNVVLDENSVETKPCINKGLQLADIGTNNISEPDLTPRMKYIMVRLENYDRTLV